MSTEQSSQPDLRLGTVLYGKQKAWTFRLQQYGSRRNVTVQAIDLDQPIEQQGDFDLVLHKVVALVADEHVDPEAAARLQRLEQYFAEHPCASLDPMQSIRDLCCRHETALKLDGLAVTRGRETLRVPDFVSVRASTSEDPGREARDMDRLVACCPAAQETACKEDTMEAPVVVAAATTTTTAITNIPSINTPSTTTPSTTTICEQEAPVDSVRMTSLPVPEIQFPCVAKPFAADGNAESHQMAMAWDLEGVKALPKPVLLQPFVNHGGYIYKIYIVGDKVFQMIRPSLPDLSPEDLAAKQGFEYFGRISNAGNGDAKLLPDEGIVYPSEELVREAARHVRTRLGITLFGLDLIRCADTGDFLLIDVNYLPGYYGVPNLFAELLDVLQDVVDARKSTDTQCV